jgi:hypothetical protein
LMGYVSPQPDHHCKNQYLPKPFQLSLKRDYQIPLWVILGVRL